MVVAILRFPRLRNNNQDKHQQYQQQFLNQVLRKVEYQQQNQTMFKSKLLHCFQKILSFDPGATQPKI